MSDTVLVVRITITTADGGRAAGRFSAEHLARRVLKDVAKHPDVIGCESTIEEAQ